ncbi:MAG TPA: hypothetical protein VKV30_12455 [Candidatus Angelobacter sp.]|nr:hypothetical protein [Candidatus Angelobacter sp.]
MDTNIQDAGKEIYAGLYLRAKRQLRSLNWSRSRSKKESTNVSEAEMERPWAGLAEWLRVAHSLLDDKTVKLTRNADR